MASDAELALNFDAFLDWLDANPETLTDYAQWLADNNARNAELTPKTEETAAPEPAKKNK